MSLAEYGHLISSSLGVASTNPCRLLSGPLETRPSGDAAKTPDSWSHVPKNDIDKQHRPNN